MNGNEVNDVLDAPVQNVTDVAGPVQPDSDRAPSKDATEGNGGPPGEQSTSGDAPRNAEGNAVPAGSANDDDDQSGSTEGEGDDDSESLNHSHIKNCLERIRTKEIELDALGEVRFFFIYQFQRVRN